MPKTYILFINVVILIIFGNQQNALSQHFTLGGKAKELSIHFKMKRDLVIVALKINNQGPFNFILVTGAGFMVITDPNFF